MNCIHGSNYNRIPQIVIGNDVRRPLMHHRSPIFIIICREQRQFRRTYFLPIWISCLSFMWYIINTIYFITNSLGLPARQTDFWYYSILPFSSAPLITQFRTLGFNWTVRISTSSNLRSGIQIITSETFSSDEIRLKSLISLRTNYPVFAYVLYITRGLSVYLPPFGMSLKSLLLLVRMVIGISCPSMSSVLFHRVHSKWNPWAEA